MDENQNNSQEFKREAKETVNQVKDSFKNVNMQDETNKAKNFFTGILKAPAQTINGIAHDASNSFFKTGIVVIVAWILLSVVCQVASIVSTIIKYGFKYLNFFDFFKIFLAVLAPIMMVIIFSGITYFFHSKNNKKSFLTVVNTTVASFVPFVVTKVVTLIFIFVKLILTPLTKIPGLLGDIFAGIGNMDTPINCIFRVISVILLFLGLKELSGDKEDGLLKKFILIEAIYFAVAFLLSLISIGIYIV